MKYSGFIVLASIVFCAPAIAQTGENNTMVERKKIEDPRVYLDSIKNTFVSHDYVDSIDYQWVNRIDSGNLYEDIEDDIIDINLEEIDGEYDGLTTELLKERLQLLNERTPFNIVYNETLEKVIKSFIKKRKRSFERLMGRSQYYFPMFEEKLAKYDVPLEVKYLSIVESALNPKARSRVGATGLWQFMYATGKQYNLEVNSFVDERMDPEKASEASAEFLSDLYRMYEDWDLVLASYNAGPGNVNKAMRRSGDFENYWNIRHNLPRETQNYLPAFYATMYMFEFAEEHGIKAPIAEMNLYETDTLAIKKMITFEQLAEVLNMPEEQIEFLNPTYKLKVIPFISGKEHYVRLPIDKLGMLVSNEDKVYAYVDFVESKKEKPMFNVGSMLAEQSNYRNKYHTIKSGESVGVIAQKYGISVTQLKRMNNMRSNMIYPGKKLIVGRTVVAHASSGKGYYTVKSGDSLYSISKKLPGVSIAKLCKLNNMEVGSMLHPGMKLKIK